MIQIRIGTPSDMPAVLELIQELAIFEREPNAVVVTADDLARDGFGPQPMFGTFVAEVEGKIVGMALYYYRYSTWKGRTIHLEDLIVQDAMRGQGVGEALYAHVLMQAQKDGVRRVEWNVLDWNTPAIAFYQKSGARVLDDWRVAQMDDVAVTKFVNQYFSEK
ncbi:GNAT family N-acetyltransferase [Flavobacterium sp. CYK-55]|nr:GNAT family N-acetyltransferase [Flavobacterium sp. CYK-55]MBS7785980.1 GNAT family N-acetyltransferase [Flavobacterium sp. CYK-55]